MGYLNLFMIGRERFGATPQVSISTSYLKNKLLLISINWKLPKPAIQLPKKMVLSYVFQVLTKKSPKTQHSSPENHQVARRTGAGPAMKMWIPVGMIVQRGHVG